MTTALTMPTVVTMVTVVIVLPLLCVGAAATAAAGPSPNVLMIQALGRRANEASMRRLGELLQSRHGYRVTQLRWLTGRSGEVNTTIDLISRSAFQVSTGDSHMFDGRGRYKEMTDTVWNGFSLADFIRDWVFLAERRNRIQCSDSLRNEQLKDLLSAERFDVAIIDAMWNECGILLARQLQLPVIGFWGQSYNGAGSEEDGATNLASQYPQIMSGLPPEMNLPQRTLNVLITIMSKVAKEIHYFLTDWIIRQMNVGAPSARKLAQDIDLVFIGSNFFASQAIMLPPKVVTLGCFDCDTTINRSARKKLQKMTGSKANLVTVFLDAENLNNAPLPIVLVQDLLKSLQSRKEKIVASINGISHEQFHNFLSPNIFLTNTTTIDELTQFEATRLLITDCSLNNVVRSLHHAIPVLCLPLTADQAVTGVLLEQRNLGAMVAAQDIDSIQMGRAMDGLLYVHSQAMEAVQRASVVSRAEMESGVDKAHRWISLLVSDGPLPHLHISGKSLHWFQYWMLDLLLIYATAIVAICALFVWLAMRIYRFVQEHRKREQKRKQE